MLGHIYLPSESTLHWILVCNSLDLVSATTLELLNRYERKARMRL